MSFKFALGFAAVYALCGFVLAVAFVLRRSGGIDPAAEKGTIGFRLLVLPGMIALWPLFFVRDHLKRSSVSDAKALSLRGSHRIANVALAVFAAFVFVAALVWRAPGFGDLPVSETPLP